MMTASLADMTKVLVEANNETIHTIDHVEDLRNPNQVPMDEIEAKVAEEFHISIEEEPLQEAKFPQKLQEFPLDIFPRSISEYIEKTCEAIKSPKDFLGLSVLVAVSALIGNRAKIQVSSEWLEPCIVYAAFVGTPGVRKTPSLRKALFPIVEIQKDLTRQYEQEKMNYEFELKQFENEFAKWKSIPARKRNIEDRPRGTGSSETSAN